MDEQRLRDAFNRIPGPGDEGTVLEQILERVGHARRRRIVLRLATALVAIAAVGFGSFQLYEGLRPAAQLVITDDDANDAGGSEGLDIADQELLAEVRALRDDWRAGKIEIDWPPKPADAPLNSLAPMSLDELFQWLESSTLNPEVSAFLKADTDPELLLAEVRSWPEVTTARFVSKEEALARLREDLQDSGLLAELPGLLDELPSNPLPDSIEIVVSTQDTARIVGERLQARPEVDEARWGAPAFSGQTILAWLKAHSHPTGESTTAPPLTAITQVPPLSAAVPTGRFLEETERMSSPDGALSEHRFLIDYVGHRLRFEGYVDGELRFLDVNEGGSTASLSTFDSSIRAHARSFDESEKSHDFLAGGPTKKMNEQSLGGQTVDIHRVEFPNQAGERTADYALIYIDRTTGLRFREEWMAGSDIVRTVTRRMVFSTPELEGLLSRDSVQASSVGGLETIPG